MIKLEAVDVLWKLVTLRQERDRALASFPVFLNSVSIYINVCPDSLLSLHPPRLKVRVPCSFCVVFSRVGCCAALEAHLPDHVLVGLVAPPSYEQAPPDLIILCKAAPEAANLTELNQILDSKEGEYEKNQFVWQGAEGVGLMIIGRLWSQLRG